jgi:hypothetical protein
MPESGFERVLADRPEVAIFGFNELMAVVYRARISADTLRAVSAAQKQLHAAHGSIAGLSLLMGDALSRPDPKVREIGNSISNEFDEIAYASAVVVNESGIQGAIIRSVLTGIQLSARRPVPQKVFADVGNAVSWIASKNPKSALGGRALEVRRRLQSLARALQ